MDRRGWNTERRNTAPPRKRSLADDDSGEEETPGAYAITRRQTTRVLEEIHSTQESIDSERLPNQETCSLPSGLGVERLRNTSAGLAFNDEDIADEEMHGAFAITRRQAGDSEDTQSIRERIDGESPANQEESSLSSNVGAEQLRKRQKKRRFVFYTVSMFVTVSIMLAVFLGIKTAGQSRGNDKGGPTEEKQEILDELRKDQYEECLLDNQYVSSRLSKLQPLVLSNVAPATAVATENIGSYQRAGLCWLSEVDDFFINESMMIPVDDMLQVSERFALASMYYHFGNAETAGLWISNWMSTDRHVCEWDFVACDSQDNRVTELILEKVILNTFIPKEIAQLSDIAFLSLSDTGVTGAIPSELSSLTKLKALDLPDNALNGTVPSEIAELRQLRHLDLDSNNLSGQIPTDIFALPHLSIFSIAGNSLITGKLPDTLSNATTLTKLEIRLTSITGTIPDISKLTHLKHLDLSFTQIEEDSFPDVSMLTNLEVLNFDGVDISGTMPSTLGLMPNLQTLSLFSTKLVGSIPSEVGLLTELDLSIFGTIPTEFGRLSHLTALDLKGLHGLTGTFPSELGRLSHLTYLALPFRSKISGTVPSDICDLLVGSDSLLAVISGPCSPTCACCTCSE